MPVERSDRLAFVVVHHHASGRIPRHLLHLVRHLSALSERLVFVSTNARETALADLPGETVRIVRPNVGYDFTSYKTGIEALGDLSAFDRLGLVNSSFICLDAEKLWSEALMRPLPELDVVGLTQSHEIAYHLQSYLVVFQGTAVLNSPSFRRWWAELETISDRERVIAKQEVGMSQYFLREGYRLGAIYSPTQEEAVAGAIRAIRAGKIVPGVDANGQPLVTPGMGREINPTHFLWDALLARYGVIKVELLARNPWRQDLGPFLQQCRSDSAIQSMISDALE